MKPKGFTRAGGATNFPLTQAASKLPLKRAFGRGGSK